MTASPAEVKLVGNAMANATRRNEKKELIPETCNCGRGGLRQGTTEYVTRVNDGVLVMIEGFGPLSETEGISDEPPQHHRTGCLTHRL